MAEAFGEFKKSYFQALFRPQFIMAGKKPQINAEVIFKKVVLRKILNRKILLIGPLY